MLRADLHLGAQNCVVAGQLGAADGVHAVNWRVDLHGGRWSRGAALYFWDCGTGRTMELEQGEDICTVLVSLSLLILVCPLADPALPPLCCVFIQHAGLCRGVLHPDSKQMLWWQLVFIERNMSEERLCEPSSSWIFLNPHEKPERRKNNKQVHVTNLKQNSKVMVIFTFVTSRTFTFFTLGVPRIFSVLFFLFLDFLLLTRLTVSLMLVGVCWVAV